jgi:hypothetical protein
MKKILFSLALISSFIFFASTTLAEDEVRKLVVDLKAKGFSQNEWFDNLDSSRIIFAPNDKFQLKLKITNEGNRNQTQIKVRQTLPGTITTDSDIEFTIPQIAAGENFIKDITVTIKDKPFIYKALTNNSLRYTVKSEVGTEGGDFTSFFTANGSKEAGSSSKGNLPATGAASTIIFGSAIASALAFAGYKLRSLARGY